MGGKVGPASAVRRIVYWLWRGSFELRPVNSLPNLHDFRGTPHRHLGMDRVYSKNLGSGEMNSSVTARYDSLRTWKCLTPRSESVHPSPKDCRSSS